MNNTLSEKTPCPFCDFNAVETTPGLALDTRLLVSNDPPTFPDAFTLKSNLLDLRRTLSQVISTISQMEAEVIRMKAQRDDLRSAIHDLETVLHPVRSLPHDILVTIFKSGIPQFSLPESPDEEYEEYDSIGPLNPLWALSSVCRRWRNITLSSPCIWSFISLVMDNYEEEPLVSLLFRLGLQIRRSGNVELDVVLCDADDIINPDVTSLQEKCVLPLLHTTTGRWSSLKIICFKPVLDSFIGCPFDKLTRLGISLRNSEDIDGAITCFRHAPHIQQVDTNYGNVELPWEGIVSYDCDGRGLANIPKMASSLRELTILTGMTTNWQPLVLPALTRLTLIVFSPSLSDMLETPALHTLCLDFGNSDTVLYPQFRQSPTCLKNVSVTNVNWNRVASEIIVFLEVTVHVTALFLNFSAATDKVLLALHPIDEPERTTPLLPKLKSLRLESLTVAVHYKRVIALVDSRPAIEELWVIGDMDRVWPEDEREQEEADIWRDFCSRIRVMHVLENHF